MLKRTVCKSSALTSVVLFTFGSAGKAGNASPSFNTGIHRALWRSVNIHRQHLLWWGIWKVTFVVPNHQGKKACLANHALWQALEVSETIDEPWRLSRGRLEAFTILTCRFGPLCPGSGRPKRCGIRRFFFLLSIIGSCGFRWWWRISWNLFTRDFRALKTEISCCFWVLHLFRRAPSAPRRSPSSLPVCL